MRNYSFIIIFSKFRIQKIIKYNINRIMKTYMTCFLVVSFCIRGIAFKFKFILIFIHAHYYYVKYQVKLLIRQIIIIITNS